MNTIKRPRIVFNAHLLSSDASYRAAGIAVYIKHLLRHLPQVDADLYYTALLGEGTRPSEAETLQATYARFPTRRPAMRILWEQMLLPHVLRRLDADLLHAPAFIGPWIAPCPQVITVHDLSFLRHPDFFRRGNRLYLSMLTGLACRRAAAVIAVSDFTAQEVTTLLGVPKERVYVVYHGKDPRFKPLPPAEVARFRQAKGLPERFILHVGTLEPRKNLRRLVRAYAQLAERDVHLVLAGGRGWLYEDLFAEVERLGLQDRVHFPGYVPADTLVLWYNMAEVFAYLSTYEGFGFPVLEAMACGIPTITSATTSLPEVAGEAALLVPPDDETAIAAALQRLLHNTELRATLRQRGLAQATQFSWERAARQTVAVYRQVMLER